MRPLGTVVRGPLESFGEVSGGRCPVSASGVDVVEAAVGAGVGGVQVALEGAAVLVPGQQHQVGLGGAVLAGVGEPGMPEVVRIPALGRGTEVAFGGPDRSPMTRPPGNRAR